ncbi:hypothetical protein HPB51_009270 [Rhipicephalus microplus]|uniref:Acetylcholine receptor subunit beta-like 1 n=1 Tax=Rhipicephalus microplus TaxID=6941 RepID=A0A9J6EZR2_RHIMP|nr:hypothetical protein HPB51_009270 [Rhipicephalus microplus]
MCKGRSMRYLHSRNARAAPKQMVKERRQLAYLSPASVPQGSRHVRYGCAGSASNGQALEQAVPGDVCISLVIYEERLLQLLCLASEDEERLVRDLFRDYNKLIRPVEIMNMTVEVQFGLSFIQLINVNEKNQIMTSNVWLQLLKWDEADYGGISVLRLPPDKVWKPDIVLFNNADGNYEVRYKSNVLIYPSGQVMWVPPAIYQSSCTIDVTYFPFDQQKCVMKFGSWTFNGDQVSLKLYNDNYWVDLSDYWKSGTWDIVEVPAFLNRHNNSKQQRPTETDISFYITIRRKTLFYTVNLILPTVLISFLCILVFYLPAEAGEKVTLGISILLSLVVFLLLVSKILPPTSLVLPLIAKYLLFTFLMNTMSILVTVIIINWNFRGPRTHRMPNWIRVLFLKYLPAMLLMKRPHKTRLRWMMEMPGVGMHHYHPRPPTTAHARRAAAAPSAARGRQARQARVPRARRRAPPELHAQGGRRRAGRWPPGLGGRP